MAKSFIRRKVEKPNPVQVGAKFGRLTVLSLGWEQVTASGACHNMAEVQCECGKRKFIRPRSLWPRGIKSCGCLQREMAAEIGSAANLKHGHAGRNRTPEYGVHSTMISRCHNPKSDKYADYGGRGIVVCDRWKGEGGYERFIQDMGRRKPGQSIERINGDGPYEPSNCRWADATEQANNRRSNRFIVFNGRRQTISQWAREVGLCRATLNDRLERGWDIERALTVPV